MKITIAGKGYVGLSLAMLLAQQNDVTMVDILPEKKREAESIHFPYPGRAY